jgi:hypothetical protein
LTTGSETCGSILALYDYVKGLGRAAPGSIRELHFFTHGWHEGPIIADTDEDEAHGANPLERDPNDKDTRLKDFDIPTILGGPAGALFKAAFSTTALVKLWGCTREQQHRDKVLAYLHSKDAKEREQLLRSYLQYLRDSTYQFKLQKLLKLPVYAAPLGWGTDPRLPVGIDGQKALKAHAEYRGKWPPTKGDRWWRVSPFFRPDGGFDFYQTVLGAQMDPVDYVAFTNAIVAKLGSP